MMFSPLAAIHDCTSCMATPLSYAPTGTPENVVEKIHSDSAKVLASAEVRERLQKIGTEPIGNSPAEFVADIKHEVPQWAEVIKAAGLTGSE